MKAPSITAVIPTRNESERIGACIASLKGFVSEIIVVDDGSTDGTAEVARQHGARVILADRGERAIEYLFKTGFLSATGSWLLMMDADEHMTPVLAERLAAVASESRYAAVRFARKNMLFGGWVRHGGWFRAEHQRFVRADAWDRAWTCGIHEPAPITGEVLDLPAEERYATIHYDYDNIPQFIDRTLFGYAQTEAFQRLNRGENFSLFKMLLSPFKRSLGRYIIRRGYRDGVRGLIVAVLLGINDICIQMCVWDLQRRRTVVPAVPPGRGAAPSVIAMEPYARAS